MPLFSCVLYLQVQSHSWVAHQPYIMQHPVSSTGLIFIRTVLSSTRDAILCSWYSFGSCARALRSSQLTGCYFSCCFADTIKPAASQTSPKFRSAELRRLLGNTRSALEVVCVRGSMKEEWNNKNRHSVTARPTPPPPAPGPHSLPPPPHHHHHHSHPSLAPDPAGNAWSRHSLVTVLTLPADGFQWNKCLCWFASSPTLYQEMIYSLKASRLKAYTPSDNATTLGFCFPNRQIFCQFSPLSRKKPPRKTQFDFCQHRPKGF